MSTTRLFYESVDIEDLTRLSQCLEGLQESVVNLLRCKLYQHKEPTSGFVTAAAQRLVASSQFVADFNAVSASMEWLARDKSATSNDTENAGGSSIQTGSSTPKQDTGTPTHQPGSLQVACETCKGSGQAKDWVHGGYLRCHQCAGSGVKS